MRQREIVKRVVKLVAKADGRIEFALRLKGGALVARSPLFRAGKKVPIEERQIEIFRPRGKLRPAQILARKTATANEPQLVYSLNGPRENYVKSIFAPRAATKEEAMKNVAGALGIRKTFTGHLDHRGITSRAHAAAFRHEAIPTANLVKRYRSAGYKVDMAESKKIYRSAAASGHGAAYAKDFLRNWVPMVRKLRAGA